FSCILPLPACGQKNETHPPRYFFHFILLLSSMVYECVAYSWYCQDVLRIACVRFNLLAQMTNVGFYQAAVSISVVAPYMRHDLIRGTDVVSVDSQQMQ